VPILLLLLLPIIEIYVLVQVGALFGFVNTVFALLAAFVLGVGIAKAQGRYIMAKMQASLTQGEIPQSEVLHGLLVFIGGVLFLIPGFVTDLAALFFVIPGPRHLLVAYFRRKIEQQIRSGQFRVFSYGNFGGGFGTNEARPRTQARPEEWTRDVSPKVIDIKPVSSETVERPDDQDR
jgi:UPF0716 protein FxsA